VIAVAIALQAASMTGAGIEEGAVRALTTVRQVMPSRLRHRLDALQFTTMPSLESVDPAVLVAISTAIRALSVLRFDYSAALRRVEPHHLVMSQGRWYLVAWDLERNDWRLFRADRVTPRTPTGPRFTPREVPGGDVGSFVSARFKGSDAANTWPCRGTVILHLPAAAVLPFAGDGVVEDLGPDRCSLELGAWSWRALAASFGRFDAAMEVVGPPELADAFAQLAARYAAANS